MPDETANSPTFEQALEELDRVVRVLEDGTTSLDEALTAYERGIALLKTCYQQLQVAEQRILVLTGSDEDGQPKLELFEHTAALELESQNARRRKPSRPD